MYLFFSSDVYDLYKRDAISSLALPENYAIHFRYPRNIVPQEEGFIPSMRGQEGIIVYVEGNRHDIPVEDRKLRFLPIRSVSVVCVIENSSTDLVHVFLRLGKFITSETLEEQLTNENLAIPPRKYIYRHQAEFGTITCEWHEAVKRLIEFDLSFKDKLFYNLNIRNQETFNKSQADIEFDKAERCSIFELTEDKHYTLDLAIYNSSKNVSDYEKHAIKLSYNTENFFITNPESIVIGADKDNRSYKIVTKDIKSNKSSAYIKIQSVFKELGKDSVEIISCEEVIRLNIKRSQSKLSIQFVLSLFTFMGPLFGAYGASQLKENGDMPFLWLGLALVCFIVSSYGQFYYFKKN